MKNQPRKQQQPGGGKGRGPQIRFSRSFRRYLKHHWHPWGGVIRTWEIVTRENLGPIGSPLIPCDATALT